MISPYKISPHIYNRAVGISTQQLCRYDFNGSTQYLNYGDILDSVLSGASPSFTIEMWVKRSSVGTGDVLFSKFDSTTNQKQVLLQFTTGSILQWQQSVNGSTVQTVITDNAYMQTNQWMYIAFTLDYTAGSYSTAGTYYINGVEVPSTASTTTKNAIYNSTSSLAIGALNVDSTAGGHFDGSIRNVVVTSRVKDATEIEARYNLGNLSEPSATGLELYSNFKTDTFSTNWTVKDLSTNANDGVSVNMVEGSRVCEVVEMYQNVVNTGFTNSIDYTVESLYTKRSTASEFNFNFTGTELWVKAFIDAGGNDKLAVMVDGSLDQTITLVNGDLQKITLAAGTKYVQLIESSRGATDYKGSSLYQIILKKSEYTKVNQGNVTDRFVFLGDSITQGSSSGIPQQINGYAAQFKSTNSKPVTILGYGGATLAELANTNLSTTLNWITTSFANTTGRKVLTIMLGTNDFAAGFLISNINNQYIALVDGINANDSDIEIFVITPTIRTDDDANLDTIRANMVTMCSTRAWCTSIDGKPIVSIGNLSDEVHPNFTGHTQLHDAIDSIIL